MASGWLIGVMVEVADEPKPKRHYFAVGFDDRAKAEWTAIDKAMLLGPIATSPVGGLEPVHMICELTPRSVRAMALKTGEARSLGWIWPRRWVTPEPRPE